MSFKPSLDQQRSCPTCTDSLLNGDFTITYDVNRESPGNVQVPGLADSSSGWGEGWWGWGLQLHLVPSPWVLSPRLFSYRMWDS